MLNNNIFVDNEVWDKIEQALSGSVRSTLSEKGHDKLRVTSPDDTVSSSKAWSTLALYDEAGNPIYFVRGGIAAEQEYLEEIGKVGKVGKVGHVQTQI